MSYINYVFIKGRVDMISGISNNLYVSVSAFDNKIDGGGSGVEPDRKSNPLTSSVDTVQISEEARRLNEQSLGNGSGNEPPLSSNKEESMLTVSEYSILGETSPQGSGSGGGVEPDSV
ncbi:hypothetical protein [Shewanella surugensis]|uniref:Uncharacterized protein n=1 Tax=Shewanella surugensis TaxID=212020 RepID=A0ABT0L8U8_9GAMM|nr:hypothetical protein [Shewanella surugensis]MCL1124126.1 hypothetical protein [Shewanella surugensis]